MQELILGPVAIWFGVPALVGTAFFTLRMALSLVGGVDTDAGFDVDVDVDFDVDMDVDAVSETGATRATRPRRSKSSPYRRSPRS